MINFQNSFLVVSNQIENDKEEFYKTCNSLLILEWMYSISKQVYLGSKTSVLTKMIGVFWLSIFFLFLNFVFDIIHMCNFVLVSIYAASTFVRGRRKFMDENVFQSICLTTDLDLMLHMNNARYLRDCDLARIKLWGQTGVMRVIRALGGSLVLGGSVVRYRRSINLFDRYNIKTKILYWDEKSFYLEQTFVRQSDEFICCVVLAKQSTLGVTTGQVIDKLGYSVNKPECPPEVSKFIEYNDLSSEKLKKKS